MHLKRIELANFRQHRKLDVDFHGNMIALCDQNGSGKSNLIGGIQFALTGEQPGFTKADLTTWGDPLLRAVGDEAFGFRVRQIRELQEACGEGP